jgi:hypothetical protein
MQGDLQTALVVFETAWKHINISDLDVELEWQRSLQFEAFTETDLLRETAWVILCSGFKESIVRRAFDYISLCFCDWESAELIVEHRVSCYSAAMASFRNERKLNAIVQSAQRISRVGFEVLKNEILLSPLEELKLFPQIGPITVLHLAKNLGLNVAKPDRHLARLSQQLGYRCASDLCEDISIATGEQVNVVDLALWRYLADVRPSVTTS